MFASFAAEPLLTGLGAGGYMLVAPPGEPPVALDFFVAAPGLGRGAGEPHAPLREVDVDFGDAVQRFNVGAAAAGAYGTVAGPPSAAERYGRLPLAELVAPAVALARRGVEVNASQAFLFKILRPITESTPEARAHVHARRAAAGRGRRAPRPRPGGRARAARRRGSGAVLHRRRGRRRVRLGGRARRPADAGGPRRVRDRARATPVRVAYRGRTVVTNPPPSAGGILIALALAQLDRAPAPPGVGALLAAMEAAQAERTPAFLAGLAEPGFADGFVGRAGSAARRTSRPWTRTAGRAR